MSIGPGSRVDSQAAPVRSPTSLTAWFFLAGCLTAHACLLIAAQARCSPVTQELSVVSSGLYHIDTGRFDHFRVNPPLIRLLVAAPVALQSPRYNWSGVRDHFWVRNEVRVGREFVRENPDSWRFYFLCARLVCIGLSAMAGWVLFLLGRSARGTTAGLTCAVLWCFSPATIGYGGLATGDIQAVAVSTVAMLFLHRWVIDRSWGTACCLGLSIGAAIASKHTALMFVMSMPPIAILLWIHEGRRYTAALRLLGQTLLALIISWYVLCSSYSWIGLGTHLGSFEFVSRRFAGATDKDVDYGNRFSGTRIGEIPLPVPSDYLIGMDIQARDLQFDNGCFIAGRRLTATPYGFFLVALTAKVGVVLSIAGGWAMVRSLNVAFRERLDIDLACVFIPGLLFCGLIASQRGLSEHARYGLLLLPFLIFGVGTSRPVEQWLLRSWRRYVLSLVYFTGGVFAATRPIVFTSPLWQLACAGVPALEGSSLDWGQDFDVVIKRLRGLEPGTGVYVYAAGIDPTISGVDVCAARVTVEETLDEIRTTRPRVTHVFISDNLLVADPVAFSDLWKRSERLGTATSLLSSSPSE